MSNVLDFGAFGDGQMDDTEALQHAIDAGDGVLEFPRGEYRITKPLVMDLARCGRTAMTGFGGVSRLIMQGPGPAIILKGTHTTSADPTGFRPEEWERERMPTIDGLEINGAHPEADGIRIEGVMQPTLTRVLIRQVRTAVQITGRARNVLISACHIYHNTNIGVHLDRVNLHQIIITGSHISYCRRGGIRVEDSEVRNFQITGNDIEYNNVRAFAKHFPTPEDEAEPTAEIYIDVGSGSIREGTICSNTIQATYSSGGANIRFIGSVPEGDHKAGMWTISGNLIGSQKNNIHLTGVRGITISGNFIYSGHHRNILVEKSRNIVIGPNTIEHNPDYKEKELAPGVRLEDSMNCNITGLLIQDAQAGTHTVTGAPPLQRDALIEIIRCRRINLSGSQILDGTPTGLQVADSEDVLVNGCSIIDQRAEPLMTRGIHWTGSTRGSMVTQSRLSGATQAAIDAPETLLQAGNLTG